MSAQNAAVQAWQAKALELYEKARAAMLCQTTDASRQADNAEADKLFRDHLRATPEGWQLVEKEPPLPRGKIGVMGEIKVPFGDELVKHPIAILIDFPDRETAIAATTRGACSFAGIFDDMLSASAQEGAKK